MNKSAAVSCVLLAACSAGSKPETKTPSRCQAPLSLRDAEPAAPYRFKVEMREQRSGAERHLSATIERSPGAEGRFEDKVLEWSSSDKLDLSETNYRAHEDKTGALVVEEVRYGPAAQPATADRLSELTARTLLERAGSWPAEFRVGMPPALKVGDRWEVQAAAGTRVRWRLHSLVSCQARLLANGSVHQKARGDLAGEGIWDAKRGRFREFRGRISLQLEDPQGDKRTLSTTFQRNIVEASR